KLSRVGVKNSSGGTEIACISVLNAVNTSQPSGKKSSSVTTQTAAGRPTKAAGIEGLGALGQDPSHNRSRDALRAERDGRKARGAVNTRAIDKASNTADVRSGRNPKGWDAFRARRCCSLLIWAGQMSSLAPSRPSKIVSIARVNDYEIGSNPGSCR